MIDERAVSKFWALVDRSAGPDGCWLWRGRRQPDGYGLFWWKGRHRAHRYACALTNGPIPDGCVVCHRCDNPPCVNPAHLFVGTHTDNMRDCNRKGRRNLRIAERAVQAKLTNESARAIYLAMLNDGAKPREMAARYGVSEGAVMNIRCRKQWRSVIADLPEIPPMRRGKTPGRGCLKSAYSPADIVALRRSRGMHMTEFAAAVGVGRATIRHWESGRNVPMPSGQRALDRMRAETNDGEMP